MTDIGDDVPISATDSVLGAAKSVSTPRAKRGRPASMPAEQIDHLIDHVGRRPLGARMRRNYASAARALRVLAGAAGDDPIPATLPEPFAWLAGEKQQRLAILSELGRVPRPDMMRRLAEQLCREQPATYAALAWIRNSRLGDQVGHGCPYRLSGIVRDTLNRYLASNPRMPWKAVALALSIVARDVDALLGKEKRQRKQQKGK